LILLRFVYIIRWETFIERIFSKRGEGMMYGAAGAMAVMAEAIKASGAIVQVEPKEFLNILNKAKEPLVVCSPAGFLTQNKYLTSYKGLIFFAKSKEQLAIPASAEVISARKIFIPEM
jgi:hypothetical protein